LYSVYKVEGALEISNTLTQELIAAMTRDFGETFLMKRRALHNERKLTGWDCIDPGSLTEDHFPRRISLRDQ